MIVVVAAIVFVERGHRRITVQYAKRVVGRRMYGGSSTHIPLKVNTGGVIPVIFASSILAFPMTFGQVWIPDSWVRRAIDQINPGHAAARPAVRRGDHLLLLLLHGHHLQPG
jgi:preprotein translocase subunit SecY